MLEELHYKKQPTLYKNKNSSRETVLFLQRRSRKHFYQNEIENEIALKSFVAAFVLVIKRLIKENNIEFVM